MIKALSSWSSLFCVSDRPSHFNFLPSKFLSGLSVRPSGGPGSPRIHPIVGAAPVFPRCFFKELWRCGEKIMMKVKKKKHASESEKNNSGSKQIVFCQIMNITGWWFQIFSVFTRIGGRLGFLDQYFLKGLKPPTRSYLRYCTTVLSPLITRSLHPWLRWWDREKHQVHGFWGASGTHNLRHHKIPPSFYSFKHYAKRGVIEFSLWNMTFFVRKTIVVMFVQGTCIANPVEQRFKILCRYHYMISL